MYLIYCYCSWAYGCNETFKQLLIHHIWFSVILIMLPTQICSSLDAGSCHHYIHDSCTVTTSTKKSLPLPQPYKMGVALVLLMMEIWHHFHRKGWYNKNLTITYPCLAIRTKYSQNYFTVTDTLIILIIIIIVIHFNSIQFVFIYVQT
jgi:hypothetical protein